MRWAAALRADLGVTAVFLGIDRLDYTKGISQRLQAFEELLDEGRLEAEHCAFVQVAVPSRTDVRKCVITRETIEKGIDPTLLTEAVEHE